ncbi:hypothetical protein H6F67_20330 [Microcoleus sp. FACHB-1515]|uniref:hypothetical protein n=1 Tax=Cyanophyceae TaxID=3028117 RepID=UPI0016852505|nr:hypothetical protein [Microcoleus sp. FACHB-1515]MBD2092201.1 hypothetical protein [Microcoleus sp. FACHB-1515]
MTSRKPSTNESNQNVNGRPVSSDEINYRDGFVQGQVEEQRYQYERERASESNGAAAGLLIGTLLAALVGGAIALFYYNSQDRQPDVIVQPTTAPTSPAPSPQAQQSPSPQPQQTTIIQRTIERQVPAPAPQVNIQAPAPAPAAPAAPAPAAEAAPQEAAPAAEPQPPAESAAPDQPSGQTAP